MRNQFHFLPQLCELPNLRQSVEIQSATRVSTMLIATAFHKMHTWEFSSWKPSRKDSNNSAALSIRSAYSPMIQIIDALNEQMNRNTVRSNVMLRYVTWHIMWHIRPPGGPSNVPCLVQSLQPHHKAVTHRKYFQEVKKGVQDGNKPFSCGIHRVSGKEAGQGTPSWILERICR